MSSVAVAEAVRVAVARARAAPVVSVVAELAAAGSATATAASAPLKAIGTHSGHFHCDEALATAMLLMLPQYSAAGIVRTRSPEELAKCEIIVDVGGVYDPEKLRLDHHQTSFKDTMSELGHAIRLSSAGLVYRHFGREVIRALVGNEVASEDVDELYRRCYDALILEVDAIDNGVEPADGELRYKVRSGLSSRVGRLNPDWTEDSSNELANARFREAISMTTAEFVEVLMTYVYSWLPARIIVKEAFDHRMVLPSGSILILKSVCPWVEHLDSLEKVELERKTDDGAMSPSKSRDRLSRRLIYVLFPDTAGGWRVRAVPEEPGSFASRRPLPASWRGKRDEELSALAGVPGCVFVHASGFIGGNHTFEGALEMAKKAMEMTE